MCCIYRVHCMYCIVHVYYVLYVLYVQCVRVLVTMAPNHYYNLSNLSNVLYVVVCVAYLENLRVVRTFVLTLPFCSTSPHVPYNIALYTTHTADCWTTWLPRTCACGVPPPPPAPCQVCVKHSVLRVWDGVWVWCNVLLLKVIHCTSIFV